MQQTNHRFGNLVLMAIYAVLILVLLNQSIQLQAADVTFQSPAPVITGDSLIETVAGGGTQALYTGPITATQQSFSLIKDLTIDQNNTLYMLEPGRIWEVTPIGQLRLLAGGILTGTTDDGAMITNTLFGPFGDGIIAAPNGVLYFSDNSRVRRIDADRRVYTMAGSTTSGFSGDGGLAISATLKTVNGMAWSADGALYIADRDNNRIRRVSSNGIITTVSGDGTIIANPTCSVFNPGCGDGGLATSAVVWTPETVAIATHGSFSTTLYHSNYSPDRVRAVLPSGTITSVVSMSFDLGSTGNGLWQGQGLAVGPDDHLYFSYFYGAGGYLGRLNLRTGQAISLTQLTATAFVPQGDGGPLKDVIVAFPSRMSFGPDGALYFIDGNRTRVRRITPIRQYILQPNNRYTITSPSGQIALNIPSGAVTEPVTMTLSHPYQMGGPRAGFLPLPQRFRLTLNGGALMQLNNPVSATVSYSDADLERVGVQSESQLNVYIWQNNAWTPLLPCTDCMHDMANNKITFKLNLAGDYALLASTNVVQKTFLPFALR